MLLPFQFTGCSGCMTGSMNGASVHSNGTSSGPAEVHAVPVLTRLAATTASQDLAQDHLRSFGGETSETG